MDTVAARALTAVLQGTLLDGHVLGQLGQRFLRRVAPAQCQRQTPLELLHLLH